MLAFAVNYSEILQRGNEQTRQAQNEFHEKLKLFTGAELIEGFVEQKRTGSERPGRAVFDSMLLSRDMFRFSTCSIRGTRSSENIITSNEFVDDIGRHASDLG